MSEHPLSFEEASKKLSSKEITWREYLRHLFLHCTPQWRIDVEKRAINWWLEMHDPFAFSVWHAQTHITDVTDPDLLVDVFLAHEEGQVKGVTAKLDRLSPQTAAWVCTCLAQLAIKDKNVGIMKLLFERTEITRQIEVWPSHSFRDAACDVNKDKDPELFNVIKESWWRKTNSDSREKGFWDPREGIFC